MSDILNGDLWKTYHGDCIPHMQEDMPPKSIDFSVFSPPFPSLFAYTSEMCDMGNCSDIRHEVKMHLAYFFRAILRVMKPGRVVCIHCAQIPALARNQETSTTDFRGTIIRMAKRLGFAYDIDWTIGKNPQAQAIRTHSHKLLFVTLGRDRAVTAPAFVDYIVKLRAPGENAVPITSSEITKNEWIDWAEGHWHWRDIYESDTLNVSEAKGEGDTKHICPLQLEVIRRLVLLYTNPGEIVFSPFAGIGSEGFVSLGGKSPKTGRQIANQRRFYGCELKPEYFETAQRNLRKACKQFSDAGQLPLFDTAAVAGGADDQW